MEINVKSDQTFIGYQFIKTQAHIRALAKTLLDSEKYKDFEDLIPQEMDILHKELLKEFEDLSKK